MKTIAAIQADLKTSPVGTRSRLTDELAGKTILRRTVERISRAKRIEEVYVLCPSPQLEHCKSLLEGTGAVVRRFDADPPHWGLLTQTARKWSLEGWRGGIGGTTSFDEYTDCRLLSGLLKTVDAQAVLSVPAAAPLIDPEVADAMIQHREDAEDDLRVTFTQAPPGLTGILLEAPLVNELAEKGTPLGWVFAYQPGNPRKDLIFQPCCYELPSDLRYAVGRLIADTDRSAQAIADLLRDHDEPDSLAIGRWLAEKNRTFVEPLPREVEIELTTDDPYPQSLLRPRGSRVPGRGPIDLAIVEKIVSELARFDDALLVLGGFGDPLRHPQFAPVLDVIRSTPPNEKMIYGLAVRTSGVDL
ncbi:MAG: NTP transferase domain-containing protein, partial [Phycisphaerales bacterium]